MKTIREYCTLKPLTINASESIEKAKKLMDSKGIRHLPVIDAGKTIGVVSDRDIEIALTLMQSEHLALNVGEICAVEPFSAKPGDSLAQVCGKLSELKVGSALIVDNGILLGIFTYTDAYRALAEFSK